MNWRDRLIQSNLPQPLRARQVKQRVEPVGVSGRPEPLPATPMTLRDAFTRNEIVYAALRAKAEAMTSPRLIVQQRGRGGVWQEIVGHPLSMLFQRPGARMDGAQLLRALIVSWDVYRRVYVEKIYARPNRRGGLVGLNPLDPSKVSLQPDGTYLWRSGTKRVLFQPEDLLIREGDMFNPSPVAVCLGSVDADNAQTDYIRAFFNNAGVPSGILVTDQLLTEEQAEAIRSRWRALFGRMFGRQHDIAVLGQGTSYQRMGANLDELEGADLRRFIETRICMAFGVPPLIIYSFAGLERATYSNLREAWRAFWNTTLHQQFQDWLSWMTWALLPEFESEERIQLGLVRLAWDYSTIPALQQDDQERRSAVLEAFSAGLLTLNDARVALGYEPDPSGDVYLWPSSSVPQPRGGIPPALPEQAMQRPMLERKQPVDRREQIAEQIERELVPVLRDTYRRAALIVREQHRRG